VVVCLERGADLHVAHLMPLPLTVSCFSKIQISFTFLVPAHLGSPRQRAVKLTYVCKNARRTTVVFGILVDSNIEERGAQPLQRDGNVADSSEHDLRIQMLDQVLVQASADTHIIWAVSIFSTNVH